MMYLYMIFTYINSRNLVESEANNNINIILYNIYIQELDQIYNVIFILIQILHSYQNL
jgi:hypothetical protein